MNRVPKSPPESGAPAGPGKPPTDARPVPRAVDVTDTLRDSSNEGDLESGTDWFLNEI